MNLENDTFTSVSVFLKPILVGVWSIIIITRPHGNVHEVDKVGVPGPL